MRRECRERFVRHRLQWRPLVSEPDMQLGTCVKHGVGIANPRWRGKRSRHSRRMRNRQILHIWQEAHEAVYLTI